MADSIQPSQFIQERTPVTLGMERGMLANENEFIHLFRFFQIPILVRIESTPRFSGDRDLPHDRAVHCQLTA